MFNLMDDFGGEFGSTKSAQVAETLMTKAVHVDQGHMNRIKEGEKEYSSK